MSDLQVVIRLEDCEQVVDLLTQVDDLKRIIRKGIDAAGFSVIPEASLWAVEARTFLEESP